MLHHPDLWLLAGLTIFVSGLTQFVLTLIDLFRAVRKQ
jgi:hypothetical protein